MVERNGYHPFGPDMADYIFETHSHYDECSYEDAEDIYCGPEAEIKHEDLFDGDLQSYHFRHQGELEIGTAEELRWEMKNRIERYKKAHAQMSFCALKWHYLMEDLEQNPQLMKQFMDIQLQRKLGGSSFV